MNVLSQIFAGATAAALMGVGVLEIFFHGDRRFHSLFLIEPEDVPATRMWAMNIKAPARQRYRAGGPPRHRTGVVSPARMR